MTPDNFAQTMLQNQEPWTIIAEFVAKVIERKQEDNRKTERQSLVFTNNDLLII